MYTIISPDEEIIRMIKQFSGVEVADEDKSVMPKINDVKPSAFNFCTESKNDFIIFNTLYNSLIRLTRDEYEQYLGNLECDDDLSKSLFVNGIFISNKIDEKKSYLSFAEKMTEYNMRPLEITVATTMRCNARCAYCYERGVAMKDIFSGAEQKIIDFIKTQENYNEIRLNLFGGEPLLNIPFIDCLVSMLKSEQIKFTSYLITNGSKIDADILEKFADWNVRDVQVTLDGTKKIYAQRKNYTDKKDGNFYKIIGAITLVASKKINVHIRLNIDRDNLDDIIVLASELEDVFADYSNVVFYPAFLTDAENKLTDDEKTEFLTKLLNTVSDTDKITVATKFYSHPRTSPCMKKDIRSFAIDTDGNIFCCEHFLGQKEKAMGNINSSFKETREPISKLREKCENCVFLPKCLGGCETNYETGDSPCMIEKYMIEAYMKLL